MVKEKLKKVFNVHEKEEGNDISYGLIRSFGLSLMFAAVFVAYGLFVVPDTLFLGAAILALTLSFVASLKNGFTKSIIVNFIVVIVALFVAVAVFLKLDLNALNNGLSLLALSFSFMFLPSKTNKEKMEKEVAEENRLKVIEQNKLIDDLKSRNEELKESEFNKNISIESLEQKKSMLSMRLAEIEESLIPKYQEMLKKSESELKELRIDLNDESKYVTREDYDKIESGYKSLVFKWSLHSDKNLERIIKLEETLKAKDRELVDLKEDHIEKLNELSKEMDKVIKERDYLQKCLKGIIKKE